MYAYKSWSGAVLKVVHPERALRLRTHELGTIPEPVLLKPKTVYLKLRSDMSLERAPRSLLLEKKGDLAEVGG